MIGLYTSVNIQFTWTLHADLITQDYLRKSVKIAHTEPEKGDTLIV